MTDTPASKRSRRSKRAAPPLPALPAVPYQPTEREAVAVAAQHARARAASPSPALRIVHQPDKPISVEIDHADPATATALLMAAIGTTDHDFFKGFLTHLSRSAQAAGQVDQDRLNFTLSVVKGIAPQDHIEAMIAAQMATVHIATLDYAHRLATAPNPAALDVAERGFNKLARTFAAQAEGLKRYRSVGEQTVRVLHQHVSISGGQAIIGAIQSGEGGGCIEKGSPTS